MRYETCRLGILSHLSELGKWRRIPNRGIASAAHQTSSTIGSAAKRMNPIIAYRHTSIRAPYAESSTKAI